jgi:GDPmannose 4,6-dehydratase
MARRSTSPNIFMGQCEINPNFSYITMDITDVTGVRNVINDIKPDEFYSIAAQTHVGNSFKEPLSYLNANAIATIGMLEAIKECSPKTKYYFAATSECFGFNGLEIDTKYGVRIVQDEKTPMQGNSPYAISKIYGCQMTELYRKSYGLFTCCGLLFNHCSPRRGEDFVTRKITKGVASIKLGLQDKIRMGNLNTFRDEGYAPEYVYAMWRMMQHKEPDNYVIATGQTTMIEDMLRYVCELADLDINDVYQLDPQYIRPLEVPYLLGNSSKAFKQLGWEAKKTWKEILEEMYENDLEILQGNLLDVK